MFTLEKLKYNVLFPFSLRFSWVGIELRIVGEDFPILFD